MEKSKSTGRTMLKYTVAALAVFLLCYKSVYFKKLSSIKKTALAKDKFDASAFVLKLSQEKLPARLDSAVALTEVLSLLSANKEEGFAKYSKSMSIGNIRYFLVKLTGVVTKINEDDITLQIRNGDSLLNVSMATEFIYGNAIRDATGLVDINDFTNSMDLNNISEQFNSFVRKDLLPLFKTKVKTGDKVEVTGALEMNKEHIDLNQLEIIPILRLKIFH